MDRWFFREHPMHRDHKVFNRGLRREKRLLITYISPDLGCNITRWCAPKECRQNQTDDGDEEYHFWDKNRPDGDGDLILTAEKIVSMKLTKFDFKIREFAELIQNAKQDSKQLTTVS
jgi:hypothetical protein